MTPQEEHGEIRYRWMLEQSATQPWVDILLADDWLEMDSYRPSRDYVLVKYCDDAMIPHLAIASRGWHPLSSWYAPRSGGLPLPIVPYAWKPIDLQGHASIHEFCALLFPPAAPWKRPPETVHEPGPVDARVTPGPLKLLLAMRDGAVLRDRIGRWRDTWLHRPGQDPERMTDRPINALRKLAFIERIGTLPPGHPTHVMEFDWRISGAGHAWLAAHPCK